MSSVSRSTRLAHPLTQMGKKMGELVEKMDGVETVGSMKDCMLLVHCLLRHGVQLGDS